MRNRIAALLVGAGLLASGFALGAAGAGEEEKPAVPAVADLAWLAGSWRAGNESDGFEEHWLPAAGGTMAAVSRNIHGGKTGLYELSAIEPGEGGRPVLRIRHFGPGLAPWKSEAEGTPAWPLLSAKKGEAVFEDPAREFPRRIVYRLVEDDLVARLEPAEGAKNRPLEFRLKKVR